MRRIKNWLHRRWFSLTCLLVATALLGSMGVQVLDRTDLTQGQYSLSLGKKVITLGHVAYAAGDVDYVYDGTEDDIQFQAALDALPATGGRLVNVSAVQLNFATVVTRAIDNVIIQGSGRGSYFTNDGAVDLFAAGGNNWKFIDLRTDAGDIDMGATTGWEWQNVTIDTNYFAYRTPVASTAGDDWEIPTGRGATFTVAASDSSASSKAQADYVADGTDDQVQIQAALDALPAVGGKVQLSEGTFNIATVIDMVANGIVAGSGYATMLVPTGNNRIFLFTAPINRGGLENLKIDDTGSVSTNLSAIHFDLAAGAVWQSTFNNIRIVNYYRGIDNNAGASDITKSLLEASFSNVAVLGYRSVGWSLGSIFECSFVDVKATRVDDTNGHGMYLYKSTDSGSSFVNVIILGRGTGGGSAVGLYLEDISALNFTNVFTDGFDAGIKTTGTVDRVSFANITLISGGINLSISHSIGTVAVSNIFTKGTTFATYYNSLNGGNAIIDGGEFEDTNAFIQVAPTDRIHNIVNFPTPGDVISISKVINHADLTDDAGATGRIDFDDAIPAGSIILSVKLDFTEAWNSDNTTTLTLMLGYVGDLDAFNLTADPGENAFNHTTDAYWGESDCQVHIVTTAKTPRVTFTEDDDITHIISGAGAQGGVTITITYIKA